MYPSIPRLPFYASKDPIDVNFHAYCIATIFRFHPKQALKDLIQVSGMSVSTVILTCEYFTLKVCLEPERSWAVKLSVVKALVLLVKEVCNCSFFLFSVFTLVQAPKYPWQPSLDPIFPVVTPRLRSILTVSLQFISHQLYSMDYSLVMHLVPS